MSKIKEIPPEKKVMIVVPGNSTLKVEAALPETYGIGIGSEYTAPFENFISDGNAANVLRMTKYTNKVGLFTEQVYTGPQQTTFTLELVFNTYYDSVTEVMLPVLYLMLMGSGSRSSLAKSDVVDEIKRVQTIAEVENGGYVDTVIGTVKDTAEKISDSVDVTANFAKISEYIEIAKAPPQVHVRLGSVMDIPKCFITEVTPEFSNILDHNNIPMSASVSVTFTFERPLFSNDIASMFGRAVRGR